MKNRLLIALIVIIAIVAGFFAMRSYLWVHTDTGEMWQKVREAQDKGLPQTAIAELKKIYPLEVAKKQYGKALRAIALQIFLESNIKGNKPEIKVNRMKEEIARAHPRMKPLMKTVLAQWYWQYYSNNRYRFVQRTQTAGIKDDDFTTWDLPKLFSEIDNIYQDLLNEDGTLKRMKLSEFQEVLDPGTAPPSLRPTLFDFVAYLALEFYTAGEQAAVKPEDSFEIAADSDAFAEASRFINFSPQTSDTDSPLLHALKIYQELLKFHINDAGKDAFIDDDINRLGFVFSMASGENREEIYKRRMEEIISKYPQSELSSLATYHLAQQIYSEGDMVKALSLADKGIESHRGSYGAEKCAQLRSSIMQKQLSLKAELVAPPDVKSKILVQYRNIDTVTLRVVKEDWRRYLVQNKSMQYPGEDELKTLLKGKPAAEVTVALKPTTDYRQKSLLVNLPPLPAGFYRIFASYRKDFGREQNCIEHTPIWVSNIAAVVREHDGMMEGFVVNGTTGAPLSGARVMLYSVKDYNEKNYRETSISATDGMGCFSIPIDATLQYQRRKIYVSDGKGSEYLSPNEIYYYGDYREKGFKRTVFFTDRSIYRPGQTIHFKGIIIDVDQSSRNYRVIPGKKVTASFRDVNNQEVAASTYTTNNFGSFSGTFTAPKDRLTGNMTIIATDPTGSCSISVEEYKRPKFTVKIDTPGKAFRLDENVTIDGVAESYMGAPIDGAKVTWRVTREVTMPSWWYFFEGGGASFNPQEIAHGTATTDEKGKFTLSFTARPDPKVKKSDEPTFLYSISADVTDSAGETRSDSESIRLGYTSMEATLGADSWQVNDRPVVINIKTSTLDGKPESASGSLEIFSLKQPEKPVRPGFLASTAVQEEDLFEEEEGLSQEDWSEEDSPDMNAWPQDKLVKKSDFKTDSKGECQLPVPLKEGAYRARLSSKDSAGNKVTAMLPLVVCNRSLKKFPLNVPSYYVSRAPKVEVGDTFEALWGTGYEKGKALVEIFRENRLLRRYWTQDNDTQSDIRFPVDSALRGGFTLQVTYIREQKLYTHRTDVDVPWSDRELSVTLDTFRSKLLPGSDETWTLKVKGPGAQMRAAELVATLYDESLDAFRPHHWNTLLSFFFQNYTNLNQQFTNMDVSFYAIVSDWNQYVSAPERVYARFVDEIAANLSGYEYLERNGAMMPGGGGAPMEDKVMNQAPAAPKATSVPEPSSAEEKRMRGVEDDREIGLSAGKSEKSSERGALVRKSSEPDVQVRKNLNEAAFFYPHLLTDKDGAVKIVFKIPEALTKWHFMAMAHGAMMESGFVEGHTVTQKDLMIQPNPPRFLREDDELEFTAKVTNMVDKEIKGTVKLTFFDPVSGQSLDKMLENAETSRELTIPAKQSKGFSWKIKVPDGLSIAGYRAIAEAGRQSDGEEGVTPVLSRRIFVSESIPLWIRGPGEKRFTFEKLKTSGSSKTLVNQGFTVQIASNPAWYAVQALPYLMEFPHECSEQVFNRLYSNSLAKHIAESNPKIHKVFRTWKEQQPDALRSNLEKNEDLKSVLLLETPWVLDAKRETEAKRNVGILFDDQRMLNEINSAESKLSKMQLDSGAWPWFPGGRPDPFITLYIATGFGRLKMMQAGQVDMSGALRSIDYLDRWILDEYQEIVTHKRLGENNLSSTIAMYLYCRGFYIKDKPIPAASKVAVEYFEGQARKHWLDLGIRMSQAHIALGLWRLGDEKTPRGIMASIKERSETSEELGMFWSEDEQSWWWYRAPIETQALMIEAFGIIMNDQKSVEDCKVWLLKQKETQDWKTTKATADAIYALLCRGENLLAGDSLVEVTVGGAKVEPEKVEEGTGFYEKRWEGKAVKPQFGEITLKKQEKGIAWGGAHWKYLEDISKITPHAQNPLKLKKSVFVQKNTKKGPVIEPVKGSLEVGDLLKIRIELRTDRDMEYVHMCDHRGSGLEPVNVLSQYKFQDGLYYYESTKDTASHFYIDYLPRGTYVFEYPLRVAHRGKYQNGLAHIECMYAPQFSSHSESMELQVH